MAVTQNYLQGLFSANYQYMQFDYQSWQHRSRCDHTKS